MTRKVAFLNQAEWGYMIHMIKGCLEGTHTGVLDDDHLDEAG